MDDSRPELEKDDIIKSLWRDYMRTKEYTVGRVHSINSTHPLIKEHEARGLRRIITRFIGNLKRQLRTRQVYQDRTVGEWFEEWYEMHDLLFKTILRSELRGRFRKRDVRFGSPGDEDLHNIPVYQRVPQEMSVYATNVSRELQFVDTKSLDSICGYLARVHYQFIRIHPFDDGNGRIARAITDQLGISLGLPPIIAGFPRTNKDKKLRYHEAITSCAGDPTCSSLKMWILDQVKKKIEDLA